MIFNVHAWMSWCGTAIAAGVAIYTVVAAFAVRTRLKPYAVVSPAVVSPTRKAAPVTLLKPL